MSFLIYSHERLSNGWQHQWPRLLWLWFSSICIRNEIRWDVCVDWCLCAERTSGKDMKCRNMRSDVNTSTLNFVTDWLDGGDQKGTIRHYVGISGLCIRKIIIRMQRQRWAHVRGRAGHVEMLMREQAEILNWIIICFVRIPRTASNRRKKLICNELWNSSICSPMIQLHLAQTNFIKVENFLRVIQLNKVQ